MPLPAFVGPLVSGIGSLLGLSENRRHAEQNYEFQKEFAQHGIRWRVEDAKAAGLHPLSALGFSPSQYSPAYSQSPDMSAAGQGISSRVSTRGERRMQELSLKKLESEIGETDARRDYYASEAARVRQESLGVAAFPSDYPIDHQGSVQVAGSGAYPEEQAAMNPAWSRFNLGGGLQIRLPSVEGGGMSEAIESLSESMLAMVMTYMENKRLFGKEWTDEFFRRYIPGGAGALETMENIVSGVENIGGLLPQVPLGWSGNRVR